MGGRSMQKLLELLTDGNSRTLEMLAKELGTSRDDVERRLEYLEHIGKIREVPGIGSGNDCGEHAGCAGSNGCGGCSGCNGCNGCSDGSAAACKGCIPQNAGRNMGKLWEVVR